MLDSEQRMTPPMVLIVDDDEAVRLYIKRILNARGVQTIEASDGVDAIRKIEELQNTLDLLVTDVRMPKMDGVELARVLAQLQPRASVIYISGYPFDLEQERNLNPGRACAFLSKPFTPRNLADAVSQCLCAT
jgi:two-component system cell cycle sensor histidine kinase/response regulator CckA